MIRVGFIFAFTDESWLGGINYYRNLIKVIRSFPDRNIEPVVFTGMQVNQAALDGLENVEIVRSGLLDMFNYRWIVRQVFKRVFSYDWFLERLLKKHDISLLSHYFGYLGAYAGIPAIGWLPDFQHVHLPEMFNNKELKFRDRIYKQMCNHCRQVIVSSYSAQKDLAAFAPACVSKSRVLHFVCLPNVSDCPDLSSLEKKYEFKGQYFFIPNQFWRHKNHRAVVEALHLLKSTGRRVLVLATGNARDNRQAGYFDSLMAYAEQVGVLDCFRILGVIPYGDILALMKNAVAVINPSLFEGWSTTVEESKSLGKRVILSDIEVHREQAPPGGVYFDPKDSNALAEAIWAIWAGRDPEADIRLAHEAESNLKARLKDFVSTYEEIVTETLRTPLTDSSSERLIT
jgi:glycosyltransferase involved in cell wall biosynthesis